jgi:hypothetical protein
VAYPDPKIVTVAAPTNTVNTIGQITHGRLVGRPVPARPG